MQAPSSQPTNIVSNSVSNMSTATNISQSSGSSILAGSFPCPSLVQKMWTLVGGWTVNPEKVLSTKDGTGIGDMVKSFIKDTAAYTNKLPNITGEQGKEVSSHLLLLHGRYYQLKEESIKAITSAPHLAFSNDIVWTETPGLGAYVYLVKKDESFVQAGRVLSDWDKFIQQDTSSVLHRSIEQKMKTVETRLDLHIRSTASIDAAREKQLDNMEQNIKRQITFSICAAVVIIFALAVVLEFRISRLSGSSLPGNVVNASSNGAVSGDSASSKTIFLS